MFKIHTQSGTTYTFDEDNKRVLRESAIPLAGLSDDTVTGEWRDYVDFEIAARHPAFVENVLHIIYPSGLFSISTPVLRVENLAPVG